jgi:hypothetical protein
MATRERYPFPDDKKVITAFMMGTKNWGETAYETSVDKRTLKVQGTVAAYYDTAGTLVAAIHSEAFSVLYVQHAVNEILSQLGSEDRLVRETSGTPGQHGTTGTHAITWRLGDEPITQGVPFVICGPLGIQAWRAARKAIPSAARREAE